MRFIHRNYEIDAHKQFRPGAPVGGGGGTHLELNAQDVVRMIALCPEGRLKEWLQQSIEPRFVPQMSPSVPKVGEIIGESNI